MNVAEIFIITYLVVGLLAAVLIWTMLIASKRQDNKAERPSHDILQSHPFGERKTKPSRFHI